MTKASNVEEAPERVKRSSDHNSTSVFEPGYSKCMCENVDLSTEDGDYISAEKGECEGEKYKWDKPNGTDDRCICAFDRATNDAWPCYLSAKWTQENCASCDERAFCKKCKLYLSS